MNRPAPLLSVLALVTMLAGCASTPFVRGVKHYVPDVVTELVDYINADGVIDVDTRANRLADADALKAVGEAQVVTLEAVRAAWERSRAAYVAYVEDDVDLDFTEKQLRAENVARMDRLIESESERFIYGGASSGG